MIEKGLQGYLEDTRNRGAGKGGGKKVIEYFWCV